MDKKDTNQIKEKNGIDIILVHGTWATGANWTNPDISLLCRNLLNQIQSDITFIQYKWSGNNSHESRQKAAASLSAIIFNLAEKFPNRRRFIISHSHGGTVSAMALQQNPAIHSFVDGAIFMSTPFIKAIPTAVASIMIKSMREGGAFLMLISSYFLILFSALFVPDLIKTHSWPEDSDLAIEICTILLIIGVVFWRLAKQVDRPEQELNAEICKFVHKYEFPNLDQTKCLFLRMDGDEAGSALNFAHFIGTIVERFSRFILRTLQVLHILKLNNHKGGPSKIISCLRQLIRGIVKPQILLLTSVLIWFAISATACYGFRVCGLETPAVNAIEWIGASTFKEIRNLWLMILYSIGALTIFIGVLSLIFGVFSGISFGRLSPLALFIHFSIETVPSGEWTVVQLSATEDSGKWATGNSIPLRHSLIYDDLRTFGHIDRWIRARL
ncbi:MAG: hypothetical protein JOY60_02440 [Burkholderiaceae bacterium]|nr:hypothetical protein [Burkholderiaceae bacterium]